MKRYSLLCRGIATTLAILSMVHTKTRTFWAERKVGEALQNPSAPGRAYIRAQLAIGTGKYVLIGF